jgi:hypothetical protein
LHADNSILVNGIEKFFRIAASGDYLGKYRAPSTVSSPEVLSLLWYLMPPIEAD